MKIRLKFILLLAVMAVACGGPGFSTIVRAQTAPDAGASPEPDANKKEGPASGATSPTPTPSPKK